MKKLALVFAMLFLLVEHGRAQVTVWRSEDLSTLANMIEKVDNNSFGTGTYSIGKGTDTTRQVNVFRSYFDFSLNEIPTNATIDSVRVHYYAGGGAYSLKLTQLATTGTDLGQNWTAIPNGTSLHTGLAYNGADFYSSAIKTAVQNALASRKIIIGALSESESTRGSQATMALGLTVNYTYPAAQLTITARNDLNGANGGNIGVGIYPAAATSHVSPYSVPSVYESHRLNLAAYDNQNVNGKNWSFNDTESPYFQSKWDERIYGQLQHEWQTASVTTSELTTQDNNATFAAYLRTNTYTTSGTMSASENWFTSPVTLTGNVTISSGVTLTIYPDVTINLNGYSIATSSGTINVQAGATINGAVFVQSGATILGIYPSIQSALSVASSGQTVTVPTGTYTVSADVTVSSGVTLAIGSGCTLNFAGSCRLLVQGKLLVNQTSGSVTTFTSSGGQWYGIEFNYGTSGSALDRTLIENAQFGLSLTGTSPYISNCVIQNSSTGVYASGTYATFLWTILDNNTYGFDLTANGDPTISHSVLKYNNYAVRGDATSVPTMGGISGSNSFRYTGYYDVYTTYSGTINAQSNWWYPWSPSFYGNVDYSNYLGSDPNTWAPKIAGLPDRPKLPPTLAKIGGSSTDSAAMKELDLACQFLLNGNQDQALSAFRSIASRYPDAFAGGRALAFVDHILEKAGLDAKPDLTATIAQRPNTKVGTVAKSLLTGHLVKEGNYKDALENAVSLIESPDKMIAKRALSDAGNIEWHRLGDKAKGTEFFRTLIANYPEDPLSISAQATLGEWVGGTLPNQPKADQTQNNKVNNSFLQNYPNPFNPSTIIRYVIPIDGRATLKVFDVLGREVCTLVDETKLAGVYDARFEASSLPSGVYIYQLDAGGKSLVQKMLLLR